MTRIGIIDYGMGNLNSIIKSVERCHRKPVIIKNKGDYNLVNKIILPGVGAFFDGINNLENLDLIDTLREMADEGIPILGICLGMQLFGSKGEEGGDTCGLNLIPGETKRLIPGVHSERIPHIGWNEVEILKETPIFKNISNNSDFYFIHSYHFLPDNPDNIVGTTPYCGGFVSIIQGKNIYGVQFHPEKSGTLGAKVINNFVVGI